MTSVKVKSDKKRMQFNVTFKEKSEHEVQLYDWLEGKLNPVAYMKEQLFKLMLLEHQGKTLFHMEPGPSQGEPGTTSEQEQAAANDYDLDVNLEEVEAI